MLATPCCCRCRRLSGCQGWREPSLHILAGDEVPLGSGVYPGSSLSSPYPSIGAVVRLPYPLLAPPLVIVCRGVVCVLPPGPFPFASLSVSVCGFSSTMRPCRLFRFPAPVSPVIAPPLSAACTVESGAQRWSTAPDIVRTRKPERPCGTYIARSCTSMWAQIISRR